LPVFFKELITKTKVLMTSILKTTYLLIAFGLMVSCQPSEQKKEKPTLQERKTELAKKIEKMQSELDDQIKEINKNSENLGEKAKENAADAIENIKRNKKTLSKSADKLKNATEDNIEEISKESAKLFEKMGDEISQYGKDLYKWMEEKTK
jgi:Skp family chaperone for outer membrane proteins